MRSRVCALVVASMVSVASIAAAQVPVPSSARSARPARSAKGAKPREGLLGGVVLSPGEKARLKEIRGEYHVLPSQKPI